MERGALQSAPDFTLRRALWQAINARGFDSAYLPELAFVPVEQATDGPRKGLNPPPALR
jgi:hypothetical protein